MNKDDACSSARRAGYEFEPRGTGTAPTLCVSVNEVGGSAPKCGAYCTSCPLRRRAAPTESLGDGFVVGKRDCMPRWACVVTRGNRAPQPSVCRWNGYTQRVDACARRPRASGVRGKASAAGTSIMLGSSGCKHCAGAFLREPCVVSTRGKQNVGVSTLGPKEKSATRLEFERDTCFEGARARIRLTSPTTSFWPQKGLLDFTGSCECPMGRDFSQKPECRSDL
ncbi:hypothetical protein B0H11DRAFT_2436603 [Mycena galericulata]|nr:hypothetical protein B0H11DRAFT_2436603 [Mycena galericulata]